MLLKIRTPTDKAKVIEYIAKLPDKSYDVSIKIHRTVRTCPQNRLYWLWLNAISKDTGNDPADLHQYFGQKWLPIEDVEMFNKQTISKAASTTKLNTAEFTDYLDKIQIFASAELGIILPNPEDIYFEQMMDHYSNSF